MRQEQATGVKARCMHSNRLEAISGLQIAMPAPAFARDRHTALLLSAAMHALKSSSRCRARLKHATEHLPAAALCRKRVFA